MADRPTWTKVKAARSTKAPQRPPQDYETLGEYHDDYMARTKPAMPRTARLDHANLKRRRP